MKARTFVLATLTFALCVVVLLMATSDEPAPLTDPRTVTAGSTTTPVIAHIEE